MSNNRHSKDKPRLTFVLLHFEKEDTILNHLLRELELE